MTPRNLAIVWAPNLLRSGALVDEIRDIGAGSQLVELLVSEAPDLFQEAYRLLSERLRRVHERLSCDGLDERNQKLVWERSEMEETHKRRCCDRSIPGEEALLCARLYRSQLNIGHQSGGSGRHGLGGEEGGEVERELEERESRRESRMERGVRLKNQRMGASKVRSFSLIFASLLILLFAFKKGKSRSTVDIGLVLVGLCCGGI